MKYHPSLLTAGVLLLISLSSCTPTPVSESPSPGSSPSVSSSSSPTASPTAKPSATNLNPQKTVTIEIYQPDSQCLDLVPRKTAVAAATPIADAVGEVVRARRSPDFKLSSYQVNVKDGTAIVDLQLAPDSKRQFRSLSSCEQMALFGSIEKTLTRNTQWQIRAVEFTEKGKTLVL